MLTTWVAEFFMKLLLFLLLIGIITCFLEGPLVVIWIRGLGFRFPLTILLIWSIFSALRVRSISLILSTSDMFTVGFDAWAYDMAGFLSSTDGLLFWKYFEMMFTSFFDLARRGGGGGIFSMVTGMCLVVSLLLLLVLGAILGVNLNDIFALRVVALLSV